jgi:hypothetical protein
MSHQAKDLEGKRQEAESRAASGIMSLGLISPDEPSEPKQAGKADKPKSSEGKDSSSEDSS